MLTYGLDRLVNMVYTWGTLLNKSNQRRFMTKQDTIRELEQRLGREIAIEYFKNEKRVVSEEQAEIEDLELIMEEK